jgi:hypothetical protein
MVRDPERRTSTSWMRGCSNARSRGSWNRTAAEQIIPVTTYQILTTLPGLQKGRSAAQDRDAIEPVAVEHVIFFAMASS